MNSLTWKVALTSTLALCVSNAAAQSSYDLRSANKRIEVRIRTANGVRYDVLLKGRQLLLPQRTKIRPSTFKGNRSRIYCQPSRGGLTWVTAQKSPLQSPPWRSTPVYGCAASAETAWRRFSRRIL